MQVSNLGINPEVHPVTPPPPSQRELSLSHMQPRQARVAAAAQVLQCCLQKATMFDVQPLAVCQTTVLLCYTILYLDLWASSNLKQNHPLAWQQVMLMDWSIHMLCVKGMLPKMSCLQPHMITALLRTKLLQF